MQNSPKLWLILLAVVLAGAATFFLLRDEQTALPDAGLPSEPVAADPSAVTTPTAEPPAEQPAREAVQTRDAAATGTETIADPEIRAALAGFTGRVLNHDKTPAAETRVLLYRFDVDALLGDVEDVLGQVTRAPDVDAGEASTDADGRFTIRGVWPRSMYLLYAGVGTDNPTPRVVERTPGTGELLDLGDIVLRNGAILTGQLVDEEGKGVGGAEVRVVDIPAQFMQMVPFERFHPEGAIIVRESSTELVVDMPDWVAERFAQLPIPTARTASDGTFRVTGIEPGTNFMVATHSGYAPLAKPGLSLKAGIEKDVGTVTIREGEEAWGVVVDQSGQPVPDAEVLVGQAGAIGRIYFAHPSVRSNAEGEFSLLGFKAGKIVAAARREPGDPWVLEGPHPITADLQVTLPSTFALTVRLTSSTGAPIGDPEFKLVGGAEGAGALEMARFGFVEAVGIDASMERTEDGRFVFRDLLAGQYSLMTHSPGHAVAVTEFEITRDHEETIQLEPDAGLVVVVHGPHNQPIRSAAVYCQSRAQRGDMPIPFGRTPASGKLALTGMPRGEVEISARHPKYGWAHAEAHVPGPEVVLKFESPGALTGILTEAGDVPTPGEWTVMVNRQRAGGPRRAMPEMPRLSIPNAEGEFSLEGLSPGQYRVEVMETLGQFTSPGTFMQTMMGGFMFEDRPEAEVVIVSGQTSHVALDTEVAEEPIDGPSALITGSVMINGQPGTGLVVGGWSQRRVQTEVDASGLFDLGRVAEGHLYLTLYEPNSQDSFSPFGGHTLWSRNIEVEGNKDVNLDIQVSTGTLEGHVSDPDGNLASGVQVQAMGVLTDASGSSGENAATANFVAMTDENGRFQFERIPLGTYSVRAQDESRGLGSAEAVPVNAGLQTVDIRLLSTVTVSGTVDLTAFAQKPDSMWLTFNTVNENSFGGQWSEVEDGAFTVDNLAPGKYRVSMWVNYRGERESESFEHDGTIVVANHDMENVVLNPVQRVVQTVTEDG